MAEFANPPTPLPAGPSAAEMEALYRRYAPVLHARARSILGSDESAADAVQETFARVIRHWAEFRAEASPLTWMYRISTNWCLNQLRNHKGRSRKHTDHKDEIQPGSTEDLHGYDPVGGLDAPTIHRLLDGADDQTRRIIIHLYFDDLTRDETARLVGISQPTLRKRHDAFVDHARRTLGIVLTTAVTFLAIRLLTGPLAAIALDHALRGQP